MQHGSVMSSSHHSVSYSGDCDLDHLDGYCKEECVVFSEVEITEGSVQKGDDDEDNAVLEDGDDKEVRSETYNIPVLEAKPPNYMWLALCTTIFFNPLSGIVALVLAMQADAEYLHNSYEQARRLGRVVKFICVVSIVVTIVILIIVSSVFVNPPVSDVKS